MTKRFALLLAGLLAGIPIVRAGEGTVQGLNAMSAREVEQLNGFLDKPSDGYDTPPRVLEAYVPVYPVSRLLSGKTGSCKVSFTIGADGTATDARPDPDADEKMCAHGLYALRHWRFSPATKDGQPVTTRFRMPFNYDIRR